MPNILPFRPHPIEQKMFSYYLSAIAAETGVATATLAISGVPPRLFSTAVTLRLRGGEKLEFPWAFVLTKMRREILIITPWSGLWRIKRSDIASYSIRAETPGGYPPRSTERIVGIAPDRIRKVPGKNKVVKLNARSRPVAESAPESQSSGSSPSSPNASASTASSGSDGRE